MNKHAPACKAFRYPATAECTCGARQRTDGLLRPHDSHCAWCDCEEFVAVKYGTLHHLSERAVIAVRNANEHRAPNGLPIDGYPIQQA